MVIFLISKIFKLFFVLIFKKGWDDMHKNRTTTLLLGIILLCFYMICTSVSAQSNSPGMVDSEAFLVSIAAGLISLVIMVFAFLTIGGMKYVTAENVLDTEVRKNLYGFINDYPGSHLREIARELDLKPSNAAWHLRKLEQTNLVRSRDIGGKKVYYLVEGGIETRKHAIAETILRNKNALNIMQFINNHPGKHLLEISHALNLNHHTVKWHIKKMYLAELVEGDMSDSAYPTYYATEIGAESLEKISSKIKKPVRVT